MNWSWYNLSLKKRGQISLYFPAGELKSQFINPSPWTTRVSGRAPEYYTAYIELIYTFYRVFGWGMRQISGYMEDYWKTVGLDIRVPSFGHLSDRFSNLDITVKQRCDRLARQLANGENVTMVVDSTGLSFGRASQWYEEKYGRKATQTPLRKLHLAIDPEMNVHAVNITTTQVSDSEGLDHMLAADLPMDRLIADGAYYSIERGEALLNKGIVPVIRATRTPNHEVLASQHSCRR